MSACNRSVLLRFRHHVEHASLCYAHRVAQSHLAGIFLSCMGRHVTVGGFEPTSGRSTANLACLSYLNGQQECMRIETAATNAMRVRLYEPQMCECTTHDWVAGHHDKIFFIKRQILIDLLSQNVRMYTILSKLLQSLVKDHKGGHIIKIIY